MTRVLPPAEWPRLVGTEAETIWPHLTAAAQVLVVEDGAAIVGCWVLLPVLHAECVYIAPAHRKRTSVARRLWVGMRALVRAVDGRSVVTAALSDEVRGLLKDRATKLPGEYYVLAMEP